MEARRGPSTHPAVRAAYDAGEYTSVSGDHYKRGMDGWFLNMGVTYEGAEQRPVPMVMVVRHHDMVDMIECER